MFLLSNILRSLVLRQHQQMVLLISSTKSRVSRSFPVCRASLQCNPPPCCGLSVFKKGVLYHREKVRDNIRGVGKRDVLPWIMGI